MLIDIKIGLITTQFKFKQRIDRWGKKGSLFEVLGKKMRKVILKFGCFDKGKGGVTGKNFMRRKLKTGFF